MAENHAYPMVDHGCWLEIWLTSGGGIYLGRWLVGWLGTLVYLVEILVGKASHRHVRVCDVLLEISV